MYQEKFKNMYSSTSHENKSDFEFPSGKQDVDDSARHTNVTQRGEDMLLIPEVLEMD